MLTLLAHSFRVATRNEPRDPAPLPSRDWPAPPHWLLPRPGEGRF